MSKQIYIDSNGNEVLVSGTIINDNNLPHYTGTPSQGSTAEAIGALNNPEELTITPYTGVTVTSKAYKITDRLICVNFEATFSTAVNSWVNCFDIAWDTSFSTSNFGVVSDGGANHSFIQAFWNTNKLTVRINSPRAVQYRGQVFIVVK